jgi:hypothetical protein
MPPRGPPPSIVPLSDKPIASDACAQAGTDAYSRREKIRWQRSTVTE